MDYYYFPDSHWSRVVSVVIAEKGLHPKRHVVDITKNASFEPDYVRLNPRGVVPTLVNGGRVVWDARRIAAYLDEVAEPMLCDDRGPQVAAWTRRFERFPIMLLSYAMWLLGKRGERSAVILADKIERATRYAVEHPDLRAAYERKASFFRSFAAELNDDAHVEATRQQSAVWLDELGHVVAEQPWIGGERLSFADVMAMSTLFRLVDLQSVDHWWRAPDHPVRAYYLRLRQRASFRAVFECDPLSRRVQAEMRSRS